MEMHILDLPYLCLEEIFKKLQFADISRLGFTCKYFRDIAKTIFRLYLRHLERFVEWEMEKIEAEANEPENLTISEHLQLALIHSVLRILLSEAKMLKAHCWRYMREPSSNFCFPGGLILDEFERVLRSVRNKTLKKDIKPEIMTTLFHMGETFYDYFDFYMENYFRDSLGLEEKIAAEKDRKSPFPKIYNSAFNSTWSAYVGNSQRKRRKQRDGDAQTTLGDKQPFSEPNIVVQNEKTCKRENSGAIEKTSFGVKIIDILDCCVSSNSQTELSHDCRYEGFKLKTYYELRDINVVEVLPTVGLSVANLETQLNNVCKYIRNNIRWANLFHPLQDLWMLEDAIEINRNVKTASALLRQWKEFQRISPKLKLDNAGSNIFQYDHEDVVSKFRNHFGLLISTNLDCPTFHGIPLKIEKGLGLKHLSLNTSCSKSKCNLNHGISSNEFNDGNIIYESFIERSNFYLPKYKFYLEMRIQYPSFLSENTKEVILKVDQVGERTLVSINESML